MAGVGNANAVPRTADDAMNGASSTYIVSVTTPGAPYSLVLNAADATLQIHNGLTIGTTPAGAGMLTPASRGSLNGGSVIANGTSMEFAGGRPPRS